ncbi:MAG: VCBS repeat-containing protein [Phaeodactylibacter sp.]|nr:VCBS repeat-containing protein [Phaeodactylibacter sp.]MCB9053090.1 VCBS repeat-containing protein [Lewinellaceae bacterium]
MNKVQKATGVLIAGLFLLAGTIAHSQVYNWEKVEEAIFEGDTICYAYIGGFPINARGLTLFDLDNDGDLDFFIGTSRGKILYLKNYGTRQVPCWSVEEEQFAGISLPSVLGVPSPCFADISGDNVPDLLFGDGSGGGNGGTLHYYENVGGAFQFVTDTLWNIDFHDFSAPCAGDVDNDGDTDIIVGNGYGDVFFVRNLGNGQWEAPVLIYNTIDFRDDKASPTLGDLDNDSIPELLVGDAYGRIKLFKASGFEQDTVIWTLIDDNYIPDNGFTSPTLTVYGNPILGKYDEDERADLIIASGATGEFVFHRNIGTNDSAVFELSLPPFPFNNFPWSLSFAAEDISGYRHQQLWVAVL